MRDVVRRLQNAATTLTSPVTRRYLLSHPMGEDRHAGLAVLAWLRPVPRSTITDHE